MDRSNTRRSPAAKAVRTIIRTPRLTSVNPDEGAGRAALHIHRGMLKSIADHARAEFPRECCGLLCGVRSERETRIDVVVRSVNIAAVPERRFLLDWDGLLRGIMNREGPAVVGFYHSHPNGLAAPSPEDFRHAWPGYAYLIVGVDSAEARGFSAWQIPAHSAERGFEPLDIVESH